MTSEAKYRGYHRDYEVGDVRTVISGVVTKDGGCSVVIQENTGVTEVLTIGSVAALEIMRCLRALYGDQP